jgi:hypothetical protein
MIARVRVRLALAAGAFLGCGSSESAPPTHVVVAYPDLPGDSSTVVPEAEPISVPPPPVIVVQNGDDAAVAHDATDSASDATDDGDSGNKAGFDASDGNLLDGDKMRE